jgi:phosphoribosylaminoimidazole-succinocarboxamide synthase
MFQNLFLKVRNIKAKNFFFEKLNIETVFFDVSQKEELCVRFVRIIPIEIKFREMIP